ncbi:hypothetical protein Tco_1193211 [Tanacetum coccineum]
MYNNTTANENNNIINKTKQEVGTARAYAVAKSHDEGKAYAGNIPKKRAVCGELYESLRLVGENPQQNPYVVAGQYKSEMRPNKDFGSLTCIKDDEKSLDRHWVIRDFSEVVFPDDLSGLPIGARMEFRIRSDSRRLSPSEEEHVATHEGLFYLTQESVVIRQTSKAEFWLEGSSVPRSCGPTMTLILLDFNTPGEDKMYHDLDEICILVVAETLKSYADKRRKPLEFEVGDRVLLKVSPWKRVVRFGKKGLAGTTIEIDENLRFVEEPIEIVERDVKKLKRRRIPLVKVHWNSRQGAEYTWEGEDQFRKKYPNSSRNPYFLKCRNFKP